MSKHRPPADEELPLFDLPLRPDDESTQQPAPSQPAARPRAAAPAAAAPRLETDLLFDPAELDAVAPPSDSPAHRGGAVAEAVPASGAGDPDRLEPLGPSIASLEATVGDRLLAGLVDLALHLGALGAVALLVRFVLGVAIDAGHALPFLVLALVFSFFYWSIALSFWGQTPGMTRFGHVARSVTDEPLTFDQACIRWFGALVTLLFVGLPLLLVAAGGRSLSDRLSETKTLDLARLPRV
ncbi:MAG: RDD family protein [Acidobacteriota bacterium]